jgi:hypothetical protein
MVIRSVLVVVPARLRPVENGLGLCIYNYSSVHGSTITPWRLTWQVFIVVYFYLRSTNDHNPTKSSGRSDRLAAV